MSNAGGGSSGGSTSAQCNNVDLQATDTGITKDAITVEVVADTGSQAIPGMANGAVEAVQAWAKLMNDNGGLACRKVEVRTFDSKIDPNESRSGMVDSCQKAFAMVGNVMLAAADATPVAECTDSKGNQTGQPDIPATITSPLVVCNPTTFVVAGSGAPCPPSKGKRAFKTVTSFGDYIKTAIGGGAGTGFYNIGYSSPQLLDLIMPSIQQMRDQGLAGQVHGARGSDPQTAYTAPVQQIKQSGAKFVFNNATFPSFTLLQSEAKAQGANVPLWVCQSTCYDPAYPKAAGALATGVQVVVTHLPYEEANTNAEMKTFVDRVKTHNTFSISAWQASRLFQTAVESVVKANGPNGLTRKALVDALGKVRDFTANGLIGPITPSAHQPGKCIVVMTVQSDGSFQRTFPKEPGKFECGDVREVSIDPVAAFSG